MSDEEGTTFIVRVDAGQTSVREEDGSSVSYVEVRDYVVDNVTSYTVVNADVGHTVFKLADGKSVAFWSVMACGPKEAVQQIVDADDWHAESSAITRGTGPDGPTFRINSRGADGQFIYAVLDRENAEAAIAALQEQLAKKGADNG